MFFSKFERLVARRYLKAKRREGFISVITGFAFTGIALGVATLIIVMSVMNGFRHELLSRILGINGHIGIMAVAGVPFNNYPEAVREIGTFEHVQTVIPMIERQLLVSSGTTAEGAMVRGIAKEDLLKKKILKDSLIHVDVDDFSGNNVIVGARLAQKMGLIPGDEITLISPNGKVTAFGTVPRMKSYKIIGTFEVGMYEYDSNFIFMPLAAAQTYFGMKGAVSNIDVTLDNDAHLREVRKAIEESVGAGAYIYDWKQTNSAFFNAIAVERNVMFIILTLIILVAAMKAKLRRMKNLGLVVIDYLQLMSSTKNYNGNRVVEISDITRNLKIMAKELNVPVITLSQLARGPEQRPDKRPMLSDLRESGSIEQDADIVMFLYRNSYYDKTDPNVHSCECIVAKNRHGEPGTVPLGWDGEFTRFTNAELVRQEGQ